jgi:hypothetical protein
MPAFLRTGLFSSLVRKIPLGCIILQIAGTIAERRQPQAEDLKELFHVLLLSSSGELLQTLRRTV